MSNGALFGNSSTRNQNKNLLEFKAGKMNLKGKMVYPDKRKGQAYIYQSEDQLMHFCWKDRQKGTIEDDLIIFPDDIEYRHVPQCTTGRVYLLKFKSNNRKMFFWMQEPKSDKDAEFCTKLNDFLNHPPTPASRTSSSGALAGLPAELTSGLGGAELSNLLGNMDQQQLMRLLNGVGGLNNLSSVSSLLGGTRSSTSIGSSDSRSSRVQSAAVRNVASNLSDTSNRSLAAAASNPSTGYTSANPCSSTNNSSTETASLGVSTSSKGQSTASTNQQTSAPIQLSDLQNILSNFTKLDTEANDGLQDLDLMKSISPEILLPLLADSVVQERLIPFLPEGQVIPKTVDELRNTVHSPQFQQTLKSFCSVFVTGQLGALVAQFELGQEAVEAANTGDISSFAKALQKQEKKD